MIRLASLTVFATLAATPVVYAQMETGPDSVNTQPSATLKTFAELSPGNQVIARSLMDAQTMPNGDISEIWTLEQIAAARTETGWGEVFHIMQSEGLIEAGNLGEVVSHFVTGGSTDVTSGTQSMAVLPAAASAASAHGRSGRSDGSAAPGMVDAANGVATALDGMRGGNASVNASASKGNRPGLGHDLPVSAANGITTATGAGASLGINAGVTTRAAAGHGGAAVNAGAGVNAGIEVNQTITGSAVDSTVTAAGNSGFGAAAGKGHAFGRGK